MRILFLLILLCTSAAEATPSIRTLWKARGLDAVEKTAGQNPTSSKTQSAAQRLELILEFGYAMHALEPEVVHKTWPDGDAFHILMRTSGKDTIFDLIYLYESNGTLSGARIESLPKGWSVTILHNKAQADVKELIESRRKTLGIKDLPAPQPLLLKTDLGSVVFDLVDPFNAFVLDAS